MTLKITRFFTDAIAKQAKISHFDNTVYFNTPNKITSATKQQINDKFGELFLNDANYLAVCDLGKIETPDTGDEDGEETVQQEVKADDRIVKKFADLLTTVFGTSVAKSDVKQIGNFLLVKITTK